MSVTVTVTTQGSKSTGFSVRAFPDVCQTPAQPSPLPIPYPSVGAQSNVKAITGRDTAGKVMVKSSTFSHSLGDEAGTAGGGVVSSKSMGKVAFKTGSLDVKVEGAGFARSLNAPAHNAPSVNQNLLRISQLRARLQAITTQVVGLPAGNPDLWHQLVDEYVVVSAELYIDLAAG